MMDEAEHGGGLLLMREGHVLANTPIKLERTGCQSLEEAFLSFIRPTKTAPQPRRLSPPAIPRDHARIPAPTRCRYVPRLFGHARESTFRENHDLGPAPGYGT